ncbi:helix-turn-helix domain-containing protein [Tetragenococcus koreensis]|uniref:helix-turn-helix domain-containing protein n=1 Tax=Tetragenococcus koreensis TaxID=290335 RepID=UPI001F47E3F4|nr:helix-turn-helix transcriptional regulator [Tetragenococcus koreensis]MCF1614819.1 helix-turn-helix domain-containing protein [Tetragenococcus koreensis]MCF1624617.1 helix-turn-helix domain-containing protein [Tetragenococcus koreensis]
MAILDRVKQLAEKRKMTIAELERKLNFSQGSISRWSKQSPSSERLNKVADYFDVSTDYLLGRTDLRKPSEEYTSDDLDKMLDNAMSFDGKPMTDHDREVIRAYLEGKFGK